MEAREAILRAIGKASLGARPAEWPGRNGGGLEEFEETFREQGGEIVGNAEVASLPGRGWSVDGDVGGLPAEWGEYRPTGPWEADVGVTLCECVIAGSGIIVLASGPKRARLTSLAPPIHLVWAGRSQVVSSLEQALERLGGRSAVLVGGPSRSADIEGELVRGVHGPKRVLLVWR